MEDEWRWQFPVGIAIGALIGLALLVVVLIALIAHGMPTQGPYSDCAPGPVRIRV